MITSCGAGAGPERYCDRDCPAWFFMSGTPRAGLWPKDLRPVPLTGEGKRDAAELPRPASLCDDRLAATAFAACDFFRNPEPAHRLLAAPEHQNILVCH